MTTPNGEHVTKHKQQKLRRTDFRRAASIMGVVGFYVFGALDKASISEARIEISQLTNMCDAYYLSSSPKKMPDNLNDLAEGPSPLTKEVPKDPWGNDYIYKKEGNRDISIYSAGPDGSEGTADDVYGEGEGEDE
jgi:general secretion pathway protein G